MATRFPVTFRGLEPDLYGNRRKSGSADSATNVTVERGELEKRPGIAAWDDVTDGILGMWTAQFGNGKVYVVVKTDAGTLKQRQVYPTDAGSFTAIATEQTHNASDRGWAFMWADRFHYFDRGGGTRWHPDNLSTNSKAYKAGLGRPTVGCLTEEAAGGEKEGRYRTVYCYRNSVTGEESMVAGPNTPAVETRLSEDKGGLAVTSASWAAIKNPAAAQKYESDQLHFYSTLGHTDYLYWGSGAESPSWRFYDDAIVDNDQVAVAGMNKADHVLDQRSLLTNAGGEPPGARFGCWTGTRALYGGIYSGASAVYGKIMYSIAKFPTMVPQARQYTVAGDTKTMEPIPWRGETFLDEAASMLTMLYGAGMPLAFCTQGVYTFVSLGNGQLRSQLLSASRGIHGEAAACVVGNTVHFLSGSSWCVLAGGSIAAISHNRFRTILDDIPVASRSKSVMASFASRDQVWAAVANADGNVRRVFAWTPTAADGDGVLVQWDLALAGDITAMCELCLPNLEPIMLVAGDDGLIHEYPSGVDDAGTDFACEWEAYVGQERRTRDQRIDGLNVHVGTGAGGNVTLTYSPLRTAEESVTPQDISIDSAKANKVKKVKGLLNVADGNLFKVKFTSTTDCTVGWSIRDLTWELAVTG